MAKRGFVEGGQPDSGTVFTGKSRVIRAHSGPFSAAGSVVDGANDFQRLGIARKGRAFTLGRVSEPIAVVV